MRNIVSPSTMLSSFYVAVWIVLAAGSLSLIGFGLVSGAINYSSEMKQIREIEHVVSDSPPEIPEASDSIEAMRANARNHFLAGQIRAIPLLITGVASAFFSVRLIRLRREFVARRTAGS